MKLIDTHSHLYEPEFDDDREAAVARAREAGVAALLLPAIDTASDRRLFDCLQLLSVPVSESICISNITTQLRFRRLSSEVRCS